LDISGFEIINKIGQGGMASVWKARQLSLDRIVAIKVLSEGFSGEPDDVRRFQEEAQSAAKLKHPGIVQVHDANAENGMYYFIMEYVSGYTVGDWVRRKGVLSEKDALLVADCVADALGYAWERANIVHCDIKPDNIIIDEDGTVKVADLGLARTISVMESESELMDEIMGTPAYISPEQAQGETNLDFRSDIYSLGAMLYHLVTGKMMFEEFDDDEKLEKHIDGTVDDPIDVNPALSKGICWLIERMTAKDPDLREDSWDAVRADINRVRRGHLPQGKMLPEHASTVRRSVRRSVADFERSMNIQRGSRRTKSSIVRTVLISSVIAVALAAAIRLYIYHTVVNIAVTPPVIPPPDVAEEEVADATDSVDTVVGDDAVNESSATAVSAETGDGKDQREKEMYDFAVRWHSEHSSDIDASIEQFKAVVKDTRGTKYSLMAQQEIRKLMQQKIEKEHADIADLRVRIQPLIENHKFDNAISQVRHYHGIRLQNTDEKLKQIIFIINKKKGNWIASEHKKATILKLERRRYIDSLVMAILSDDLGLAVEMIADMKKSDAFYAVRDKLKSVGDVIEKAANIDENILKSFEGQYGETIDVYLNKGMRRLTIRSVDGGRIECRQSLSVGHGAVSTINITVDDLSDYEKMRRMGDDSDYEVALVKGITAFQSGAYSYADKYFVKTHPLLSKYLLDKIRGVSGDQPDAGDDIDTDGESGDITDDSAAIVREDDAEKDGDDAVQDFGMSSTGDDFEDPEQRQRRKIKHSGLNRRPNDSIRRIDKTRPRHFFE